VELKYGVEFEEFISSYDRQYTDEGEKAARYAIFEQNMERCEKLNARPSATWVAGVTQFSDLTPAEFRRAVHLIKRTEPLGPSTYPSINVTDIPTSIDWRTKNVVSQVKDQGNCGSCWAFSTTGAVESAHAIKTGKLVELSEQQLVDCIHNLDGCNGGIPSWAMAYVRYNGGQDTEESYPYKARDGQCQFSSSTVGATISDMVNITQDEQGLLQAVGTVGPVSIAFDVENDFANYKSGVYSSDECSSDPMSMNHAVLVVGYDTVDGKDYWIVKNSWGTSFGIEGYFWIQRGVNMCGISNDCCYAVV